MKSARRVRLEIYGRVQGVFFRASTAEKARELDLAGWVKNRRDGSVEAVAQGPEDDVEALVEWARTGPPQARVERLEVHDEEPAEEPGGFEVKR